jgi:hypothetical protein
MNQFKILEYRPEGSTKKVFGHDIKQYDDSIIVHFPSELDINPYWKGQTIKYNNIPFFFGTSNKQGDGSFIAEFWKNKPVWLN